MELGVPWLTVGLSSGNAAISARSCSTVKLHTPRCLTCAGQTWRQLCGRLKLRTTAPGGENACSRWGHATYPSILLEAQHLPPRVHILHLEHELRVRRAICQPEPTQRLEVSLLDRHWPVHQVEIEVLELQVTQRLGESLFGPRRVAMPDVVRVE